MIHDIRDIIDQGWRQREGQQEMEATSKFRGRVEEISAERQELQETIAWRESMGKTETIFHWKEDIRELRTRMIELDMEKKAAESRAADAEFVAKIKKCAAKMQEGRGLEEEGRRILKEAEAEMLEICKG
jgi:transcription initiation factor TFIIIB Brf1 subunit/transcription initiation factor TFIIB